MNKGWAELAKLEDVEGQRARPEAERKPGTSGKKGGRRLSYIT